VEEPVQTGSTNTPQQRILTSNPAITPERSPPVDQGSGNRHEHRLNRTGDRQLNSALHTIANSRIRHDPRTRDYLARRTTEGLSKRRVRRCLKRYIARELYRHLATTGIDNP